MIHSHLINVRDNVISPNVHVLKSVTCNKLRHDSYVSKCIKTVTAISLATIFIIINVFGGHSHRSLLLVFNRTLSLKVRLFNREECLENLKQQTIHITN